MMTGDGADAIISAYRVSCLQGEEKRCINLKTLMLQ